MIVTPIPLVDLKAQYQTIKAEIDSAVAEVLDSCAFIGGRYVEQFEADFAVFTGARHVIGVGNGTDALLIALRSLQLEPGFEALVPANTFIATAEAVTHAGGRPRFCDVDPDSYLLDLDRAEQLLNNSTRVIIPVHLYGQMMDMQAVRRFADRHQLLVVEDAAQAHGAQRGGIRIGELSSMVTYSFYPAKNLGAYGDGGAVTTDDERLAGLIRKWHTHGGDQKYRHEFEGINSRLDGLQAAVLSVKLRHLPQWTLRRREVAETYHRLLEPLGLSLPRESDPGSHVYHLYVTRVDRRDRVLSVLQDKGVNAGVHYPIALPFLEAYEHFGHKPEEFPVTHAQMDRLISLPLFPEITASQIEQVAQALGAALR